MPYRNTVLAIRVPMLVIPINEYTFNAAVNAVSTFTYTTEYKEKLDKAQTIYNMLDDNQRAQVANAYSTLTSMQQKYANTVLAYEFASMLTVINDAAHLTDDDKANVKAIKKAYKNLAAAVEAEIPSDARTKYNTMVSTANTLWPEYFINFADGAGGNEYFKVYKSDGSPNASLGGTGDGAVAHGYYDGEVLTDACKYKTDRYIIIETDAPALLTVVANVKSGNSGGKLNVKQGTVTFDTKGKATFSASGYSGSTDVSTKSGEDTNYTFSLPAAGTYQISSGSEFLIFFIIYM